MKNIKGFTLIEVMVVSLIAGIVGLGVLQVVANSNKILTDSARQSTFNSNIHIVTSDIALDIKEGYKLEIPNNYSGSLAITKRIGGVDQTIVWESRYYSNSSTDYGYHPVRIGGDGSEKVYNLIGGSSGYKQLYVYFTFPENGTTLLTGKYYGVDVNISSYYFLLSYADYWYSNTKNTFYCRIDEEGYLL
ncbi:MAG: prepilin-type N-terminal cleavage/methylation domain-containing protein [Candidatus Delongbacteria bacterium]|nr:prepilin-type N-terminal cleavage/methylation domain-containing protein [Candidatus Delongbacteria bacterium]MCG2759977.1 prepilin-type N-terminal cleavage/methylation domain-containing protein [Candidatus Delongbacteria bacterium]